MADNDIIFVEIRLSARDIADDAHLLYWTDNKSRRAMKLNNMRDEFAKLSELMAKVETTGAR